MSSQVKEFVSFTDLAEHLKKLTVKRPAQKQNTKPDPIRESVSQ